MVTAGLLRIEPILADAELGFTSAVFKVLRQSSEYWCTTCAGPFVAEMNAVEREPAGNASSLWPFAAPFAE